MTHFWEPDGGKVSRVALVSSFPKLSRALRNPSHSHLHSSTNRSSAATPLSRSCILEEEHRKQMMMLKSTFLLVSLASTAVAFAPLRPSTTATAPITTTSLQEKPNGADFSAKKVLVLGGDGFCGWPTSLYLSDQGHDVVVVDNLSRRNIDIELGCDSLTPIASPEVSILHLHALDQALYSPQPTNILYMCIC